MPYDAFWLPATPVRAVVLLAHGMAEHAGRYQRLGEALSGAGFALYAHDQRGHGRTAELGPLGLFAAENGWNTAV
ncbi:MAG TPA: alpha/beta hydrolase, partial [Pseudomonas sp.]|nr:alpha/beta hydrolase [Pseudomonas sp.]